jgi:hypothetical protein
MSKFYTYDAWVDTFKPIKNKISKYPDDSLIHFETYGEEVEFVQKADNKYIWTEVDGDAGTYIVAGYHWVNRIHYYITENPWDDEWTEVPTWTYRQCDCVDEETDGVLTWDGDPNPDCPECDEGMIDIDCDTVEALKAIYGEDAPIVA